MTDQSSIEIEDMYESGEDGGDWMGYYCRGHVDKHQFAMAANKHGGHEAGAGYDTRYVRDCDVKHVWWRTVPISGEEGCMQFVTAAGPGKGAWSATVSEFRGRQYRDWSRRIRDYDNGRIKGIEEGIQWAYFLFLYGDLMNGEWELKAHNKAIAEHIANSWHGYGRAELERERDREAGK